MKTLNAEDLALAFRVKDHHNMDTHCGDLLHYDLIDHAKNDVTWLSLIEAYFVLRNLNKEYEGQIEDFETKMEELEYELEGI